MQTGYIPHLIGCANDSRPLKGSVASVSSIPQKDLALCILVQAPSWLLWHSIHDCVSLVPDKEVSEHLKVNYSKPPLGRHYQNLYKVSIYYVLTVE